MEIKPPIYQGPIVRTDDETGIDAAHEKKSGEKGTNEAAGNAQTKSNMDQAMKQAGTEMKGAMRTSEQFLQKALGDQLGRSTQLHGWPESQGKNATPLFGAPVIPSQTQNANTVTKSAGDPTATARKEAQAHMEHGNKMLKEGRYDAAIAAYEEGFRTYPSPNFILNKASALADAGRHSEAVEAYERYLSDPDAPRADEARAAMNKAKTAMGGSETTAVVQARKEAQAYMEHGNKMLKEGRYNEAIAAYDEGFRTYPSPNFILNKASALADAGRHSEAVQAYERYLSDPNAPRADDARASMEKAKKAMGGREATATGVVESHKQFEKGAAAFQAGRYQEALAAFDKAYELNPLADFKFNQAAALEKLGKRELAAQRYEAYLAEKPNAKDAAQVKTNITTLREDALKAAQGAFERGQAAYNAGRFKEAAFAFAEAYEQKPEPNFLYNIGAAYQRAGDSKQAIKNYQLYLNMHPGASDAEKVRSHIHKLQKTTGDELMQPDPLKASQAAFDRGQSAYLAGRFKEAAAAFTEAYEQTPEPNLLYNIAAAHQQAGDTKQAIKHYQLYLNNHPDAKDAEKVRSHIHKLQKKTGDELMQPDPLKAAQLAFDRGQSAYNAGRFKEAASAFTEAYEQTPEPDILYNIGASYQKAGDTKQAIKNYQLYLNNHPDARDADKVRNLIHKLLQKTGDDLIQP